jgi:hypothetical protein
VLHGGDTRESSIGIPPFAISARKVVLILAETKHTNLNQTEVEVGWYMWLPGENIPKTWRECMIFFLYYIISQNFGSVNGGGDIKWLEISKKIPPYLGIAQPNRLPHNAAP